jgi:8-oxo-dGTP pyrophosphatase MutT (NUDIX family)
MEPLKTLIDESWYIRPSGIPERHNAGGVVVRREEGRILVALVREWKYPGYVLPKGGIERGELPETAARREVTEEAGFNSLTLLADLGTRERLSFTKRKWTIGHYFLYLTDQIDVAPLDRRNHPEKPTWFPLDELPPFFWPEQRDLVESNREKIKEAVLRI